MSDHGSLGSLLQGISQQPAHIRNDGQLTDQVNMISDVVLGLSKRPGTTYVGTSDVDTDLTFLNLRVEGQDYQIGYADGKLSIVNGSGVTQTIIVEDNALAYIGNDMSAYTYDNVIYFVNRDKVVLQDALNVDAQADVVKDVGLVTCLGGLFSHEYKVILEYPNGTKAEGVYTAPYGIDDGDASKTTSTYIVQQLANSLIGGTGITGYTEVEDGVDTPIYSANPAIQAGTIVTYSGSVLSITGVPDLKITLEDGAGNDTLRSQTSIAKSTEDLADLAPHGTLVKVIGLDDTEDDFWMRFEVDGDPVVGTSFGSEGIWREWFNAYETHAFDLTTMPHTIIKTGASEFTLSQANWQSRRTGDSNSNPEPSFVGSAIKDVSGFQSRLVFISGPNTIMSRTNIPTDFYSKSVVAGTATDPIDILATSEDTNVLQWITPFDRDLVMFGSNAQFVITGASALTPDNASMVQTTAFDVDLGIKPVSTGRTLLFPFRSGRYSGIKEFFSVNTTEANTANTITRLQDRYMLGEITKMVSSQDFNMTLVTTDGEGQENTVFVNQYLWDGQSKVQDAWHRWELPYPVQSVYFDGSDIVFLLNSGTALIQARMELDYSEDPILGYNLCLDLIKSTPVTNGQIASTDSNLVIVQGDGCYRPGLEVKSVFENGVYTVSTTIVPNNSEVYYGIPYRASFKPTMPFIRDREGKVQKLYNLVVTDFVVHYDRSGYIYANMVSRYREEPITVTNEFVTMHDAVNDTDFNGTRDGQWIIPWGERSDWSELEIYSDDFRPMSITELEWIGQPLTRGRRV